MLEDPVCCRPSVFAPLSFFFSSFFMASFIRILISIFPSHFHLSKFIITEQDGDAQLRRLLWN